MKTYFFGWTILLNVFWLYLAWFKENSGLEHCNFLLTCRYQNIYLCNLAFTICIKVIYVVSWNASGHNWSVELVDLLLASLAGDLIYPYKHKPTFSLPCCLVCWFCLVFFWMQEQRSAECPQLWAAERSTHINNHTHERKRSLRTVAHSWSSELAGQVQEIQLQGSEGWELWSSQSELHTCPHPPSLSLSHTQMVFNTLEEGFILFIKTLLLSVARFFS